MKIPNLFYHNKLTTKQHNGFTRKTKQNQDNRRLEALFHQMKSMNYITHLFSSNQNEIILHYFHTFDQMVIKSLDVNI